MDDCPDQRSVRFFIIHNPAAGRGRTRRIVDAVRGRLVQTGVDCRTLATSAPGDAGRIARDLIASEGSRGSSCIVACGGDGTVHEVANAIARAVDTRTVLGLAPAGRCNDFARALGIDGDPRRIARTLCDGDARAVDLGRIGDRYFCTVAALGFDAAVSRYVNDSWIPLRGTPAYVHGTLRSLIGYRTPVLRLTGDFGRHEGPVFLAATANTPWYGGAMMIAPTADPLDGRMNVCLVSRIAKLRVLKLLPCVMAGRHAGLPEVRMLETRTLTAAPTDDPAGREVEVWADGEPISRLPVTIECAPRAIRILLPPPPPRATQRGRST